jgi:hypothetical protein
VVDVWDSQDDMKDGMQTLAPIFEDARMELAGQTEVCQLLQIVRPD